VTRSREGHHSLFGVLAAAGLALDLGSKWLAFALVGEPQDGRANPKLIVWPDVFSITTSFNEGALWGLGRKLPHANLVFAGLSVLAALAILYWVFARGAVKDRPLTLALGLIMAGTLGNCYDRLVWGKVRDFLYFELIEWPIFNLADTWLVCGALLLMIQAFFAELGPAEPAASAAISTTAGGDGRERA
jgi:signal peptidase II